MSKNILIVRLSLFLIVPLWCCTNKQKTKAVEDSSSSKSIEMEDTLNKKAWSNSNHICPVVNPKIANNIFSVNEELAISGILNNLKAKVKRKMIDNLYEEGVMDTLYEVEIEKNKYTIVRNKEIDILYYALIVKNEQLLTSGLKIGMPIEELYSILKQKIDTECQAVKITDDEDTVELLISISNNLVSKIEYTLLI